MISTITDVQAELTPAILRSIKVEFETSGRRFSPDTFIPTWDQLIKTGVGGIWTLTQGDLFIGATGAIAHMEPIEGIMVAAQAFLILIKGYQGPSDASRLMQALELFAVSKKASRIITAVCYDTMEGRQAEFLGRHDYKVYETRYFKNLWEPKPSSP